MTHISLRNTIEIKSVSGASYLGAGGILLSSVGGFVAGTYGHDFYTEQDDLTALKLSFKIPDTVEWV